MTDKLGYLLVFVLISKISFFISSDNNADSFLDVPISKIVQAQTFQKLNFLRTLILK